MSARGASVLASSFRALIYAYVAFVIFALVRLSILAVETLMSGLGGI